VSVESKNRGLWKEKVIIEERKRDETNIRGRNSMVLTKAPDDDSE
jgi:hypothetical protein